MSLTIVPNKEIKFWEYLDKNPRLYDGIDLTGAEIEYINNEFWDYNVKPAEFENHFRQAIRRCITQYKNLKAIEFCDRIFDITTNESIRNIARDVSTTNDGTKNNTRSENNTTTGSLTESGTDSNTRTEDLDSKTANKELPMNSYGDDFEDIVDWSKGASNISESKGDNTVTDSGTNSRTQGTTGSETIQRADQEALHNLETVKGKDKDKYKAINGQGVVLIKKIYDYILEPKALHYLVGNLQKCFILVY